MSLKISQITQKNLFPCPHWVHTKTADGKELVTITGIAAIDMKMPSPIPIGWHRDRLELELLFPVPYPAGYNEFQVEQWALNINPCAFYQQQ